MDSKSTHCSFDILRFGQLFVTQNPLLRGYLLMKAGPDHFCIMHLMPDGSVQPATELVAWEGHYGVYQCRPVSRKSLSKKAQQRQQQSENSLLLGAGLAVLITLAIIIL